MKIQNLFLLSGNYLQILKTHYSKGFTLIELLVVIGILSILVVGLIVAINPQDKLNAASDSKVISASGAIARAAEAFATSNSGNYPPTGSYTAFTGAVGTAGTLVGNGELKVAPAAPNGYNTGITGGYRIATDGTGFIFASELKSRKYTSAATPTACNQSTTWGVLRYTSSDGRTCYGCVTAASAVAAVNAVTSAVPATCTAF